MDFLFIMLSVWFFIGYATWHAQKDIQQEEKSLTDFEKLLPKFLQFRPEKSKPKTDWPILILTPELPRIAFVLVYNFLYSNFSNYLWTVYVTLILFWNPDSLVKILSFLFWHRWSFVRIIKLKTKEYCKKTTLNSPDFPTDFLALFFSCLNSIPIVKAFFFYDLFWLIHCHKLGNTKMKENRLG